MTNVKQAPEMSCLIFKRKRDLKKNNNKLLIHVISTTEDKKKDSNNKNEKLNLFLGLRIDF